MRIYLAFALYLTACMLLSALLLPWIQPFFADWLDAAPDRSLYRFGMLLTALGLPLLLRALDLSDRLSMGWISPAGGVRRALLSGLGMGILMLALVILGLLLAGVREVQPERLQFMRIASAAISGLGSGLAVGLIEEFFFRGPLQGGMRRTLPFWPMAVLTGVFYALLHFIRPAPLDGAMLTLMSSLGMLAGGLGELANFNFWADSFVTLTVAGIFLAMTRERTGSLALAIGVHSGWVTVIRVAKHTTGTDHQSPWIWLIGDYDNVTGWLASAVIGGFALIYWLRRKPPVRMVGSD